MDKESLEQRIEQVVARYKELQTSLTDIQIELHRLEGEHRLLLSMRSEQEEANKGEKEDARSATKAS